jgi:IS4 transposase
MARLGLQRALSAEWVDALFEAHREKQYTRELLFSTTVDLMSQVAVGLRPSLNAAAQKAGDALTVSVTALYDKVNHTEPAVTRALVAGSATRLAPVMTTFHADAAPWLRGWRIRIIDGNHLPASEKRLKPLRGFPGAALPGLSLVVYDPDVGMVIDLVPCEDAHAGERPPLAVLLANAQPGELWLGDRNFCTRPAIRAATAGGAAVLFREHGSHPNATAVGRRRKIGRVETGVVYEQTVTIPADEDPAKGVLYLRRIEIQLDEPTEDGDTVIRLLTTLPRSVQARAIARLYRKRWTIERLFGRLEAALQSEIRTLSHPRAALLAFALAVVAFNVLALIEAAIAATHDLDAEGIALSTYYVADDVRSTYTGMMIAILAEVWARYDAQSPRAFAATFRQLATRVDPKTLRSHPRGPKIKRAKRYVRRSEAERHVATAQVLREGRIPQRP